MTEPQMRMLDKIFESGTRGDFIKFVNDVIEETILPKPIVVSKDEKHAKAA